MTFALTGVSILHLESVYLFIFCFFFYLFIYSILFDIIHMRWFIVFIMMSESRIFKAF